MHISSGLCRSCDRFKYGVRFKHFICFDCYKRAYSNNVIAPLNRIGRCSFCGDTNVYIYLLKQGIRFELACQFCITRIGKVLSPSQTVRYYGQNGCFDWEDSLPKWGTCDICLQYGQLEETKIFNTTVLVCKDCLNQKCKICQKKSVPLIDGICWDCLERLSKTKLPEIVELKCEFCSEQSTYIVYFAPLFYQTFKPIILTCSKHFHKNIPTSFVGTINPECEICSNKSEFLINRETTICSDCKNTELSQCERCNRFCLISDIVEVEYLDGSTAEICEECSADLFYCESCGRCTSDESEGHRSPDGDFYCSDCFFEYYDYCSICRESFRIDDLYPFRRLDGDISHICQDCIDELNCIIDSDGYAVEVREILHSYSYKPYEVPNDKVIYYGIELEVEGSIIKLEGFHKRIGLDENFFILKEDSSVDAEVNFKPVTWEEFKQRSQDFQKVLDGLKECGFVSYDAQKECGIHIHISKSPFTTVHLYKLFELYYTNPDLVTYIARRKPNSYWGFNYDGEKIKKVAKDRTSQTPDRYELINVTDETLEIRCFKGTLNWESFKRYVEFVHTTVLFTQEASIRKITLENYFKWLEKHQNKYPLVYNQVKKFIQTTQPV